MHSSQRSDNFINKVMGRNGHSAVGESRASLGARQQHTYQRNPNIYGNQQYLEHIKQQYDEDYMQQFQAQDAMHGGGDFTHEQIYSKKSSYYDHKYPQHQKSQTEFTKKKSDETFSQKSYFSDRTDSTKQTALRKQSKNGKQLMDLVSSKASLHKIIEDGITGVNKPNPSGKTATDLNRNHQHAPPNTKFLMRCESEECLPCSSSKSAERINDKIIHPMVKKFRLLYLHNIKEEVGIMEDLESLPNKLAQFCKDMEKDLPRNF